MIWEIDQPERGVDGVDAQGRPDPAYAAALGLRAAPLGRRVLAFLCDLAGWILLQVPLWIGMVPLLLKLADGSISLYGFVNHPDFVFAVVMASVSAALMLAYAVVQWMLHGTRGVTIGKAVTGIRSVNTRTLERPRIGAVLLRFLIVGASGIVPVVGPALVLVSPTFDPQGRGRGLHDRATGVWLVDVRRGLDPYDEKRMRIARKTVKAEPLPERAELPSLATPSDPSAQAEYRPGSRISAGVLGVGRGEPGAAPAPGPVAPAVPAPVVPGVGVIAAVPSVSAPARAAAPVAPAPAAPPVAPAPVRYGIRWDTGETLPVDEPILIGRDPDAAARPGARPVGIADASRSLSKTHALLRPVDGGIEMTDWHSTNGCALIRGGDEQLLAPGVAVSATDGDTIRLGDRRAEVVRV